MLLLSMHKFAVFALLTWLSAGNINADILVIYLTALLEYLVSLRMYPVKKSGGTLFVPYTWCENTLTWISTIKELY